MCLSLWSRCFLASDAKIDQSTRQIGLARNDPSQHTHYAVMTSLLRQNDVILIFDVITPKWRRSDVIATAMCLGGGGGVIQILAFSSDYVAPVLGTWDEHSREQYVCVLVYIIINWSFQIIAFITIIGVCQANATASWILSFSFSTKVGVCPSVCAFRMTLPLCRFTKFRRMMHSQVTPAWSRLLNWPCSAILYISHGTLKFAIIAVDQVLWRR